MLPGNIGRDIRTVIEPHQREMKQNAHTPQEAEFKEKCKTKFAEEKKRHFEELIRLQAEAKKQRGKGKSGIRNKKENNWRKLQNEKEKKRKEKKSILRF
jgi:hypothetical protein